MILAAGADLSRDGAGCNQEPDAWSKREPFTCRGPGALLSSRLDERIPSDTCIVALSARRDCERALTMRGNP